MTKIHHLFCTTVFMVAAMVGCQSEKKNEFAQEEQDPVQQPSESPAPAVKKTPDRSTQLSLAENLANKGNYNAAAEVLRQLLLSDADDVEAIFSLATYEAADGKLAEAIDLLEMIPQDHPEAGIPALGQAADWCLQLQRFQQAASRYEKILEVAPEAYLARRQLAFLLNRQGRRQEASIHIRELCRQGNVRQDELHSLISLSDAMFDEGAGGSNGAAYSPVGTLAFARRQFNLANYAESVRLLQDEVASGTAPQAAVAFFGRAAAEAQNDEQFRWWLSIVSEATQEHAEYWAAIGIHLVEELRFDEAARAFMEALDRDPTDVLSIGRLRQTLVVLKDTEGADKWEQRWESLRRIVLLNNRVAAGNPNDQPILELADELESLDRRLEALMWRSIAMHQQGSASEILQRLNQERQELIQTNNGFQSDESRLCGMSLSDHALPELNANDIQPAEPIEEPTAKASPARFANTAANAGIKHTFQPETQPQESGFTIYQLLGGAVAVLDYDCDGQSDLYFAQGGADPPTFVGLQSNQLYRAIGSAAYEDVTVVSQTSEHRYSTSLTAGDWNQDGFTDLMVANLGQDRLLINNGDGTFTSLEIDNTDDAHRVPSSMAMADLTGDGLPDLFQACYVNDPAFAKKPNTNADGQVIQALLPTDFQAGDDRILTNQQDGGFRAADFTKGDQGRSTGLGVVVTDFDGFRGNEVFVGNDLNPNQLWKYSSAQTSWSDVGSLLGCAFGSTGKATASMGIAAGDFDNSGTLDLHVTNYQDENASLFLGRDGAFQDRNIQYQLATDSASVLGFGTQAVDYDNDGRLDLAVTNGHIEQAVQIAAPFRQPAQLFANLGTRFQRVDVQDASGYWKRDHVGRSMARLDANRDGRTDIVVTHLGEPSALLINQTDTNNHWIQLKLVGTSSERDGIGARIRLQTGDREWFGWVTAGDGYFSRNEPVVAFGLADENQVDSIEVTWPSGKSQSFTDLAADQRFLVIESQADPFSISK